MPDLSDRSKELEAILARVAGTAEDEFAVRLVNGDAVSLGNDEAGGEVGP